MPGINSINNDNVSGKYINFRNVIKTTEAERDSAKKSAMGFNGQVGVDDIRTMSEIEKIYSQERADKVNQQIKDGKLTANKSMLAQEDFLTLLVKELQYQDPLEPMDNKEFIGQMAQFSNLQQTTEITQHLQNLLSITDGNQAYYMLGKEVAYINPNEIVAEGEKAKPKFGIVEAVTFDDKNNATLKVGDSKISIYDVIQVNADNNK